ncbi:cysteine desulfurase /L-selenocysteine selenide-lyase (L-alanine-forming) [Nocardia tenerifensis]|uniref:cysteine desulfurase n=1 Tax=Nocardia tenerifensis TaxID=228006 RepID=A0A318K9M8_9NOCA|nr:cysteine desulfurase [Nocardia tenerifensis]PXX70607.1 cysteine desulfurase /L-selenocysteine selenide-lyase (L-alanine-forming) [Nocardia tenerifensis]
MTGLVSNGKISTSTLGESVRPDFPILERRFGPHPLVYLDNAATAQKPRAVLDALVDYYSGLNSNIGRGYYRLSMAATDAYEAARETVRRAINAEHADEVVFTAGTTAAINLLADTFGRSVLTAGDRIVVTGMEHNSNMLPWRRLCETTGAELVVVPVGAAGRVELERFTAALDPGVRLAAVAHVSNVLGTVNPVREMIRAAHGHGIPVVVDGAQAVPHRPVDVRDLDADFYCFSGHKIYGPMGIGVLYGKRELLSRLAPYQVGGGTVKGVTLEEPVAYVPVPARLEAGTPHVAGSVGLAAAFDYVEDLGWDVVRRHDDLLVGAAVEALESVARVRIIGDPAAEPSGIVSFVVDGIHPYDVGGHLDGHGVAVRSGVHCANVFIDTFGEVGTVRLSFAVYNTEAEIDLVRRALTTVRPGFWTAEYPTERFLATDPSTENQH